MQYLSSADPREQTLGMLLAAIWTDLPPNDNDLVVPFASSESFIGRPDVGGPVAPRDTPPRNNGF